MSAATVKDFVLLRLHINSHKIFISLFPKRNLGAETLLKRTACYFDSSQQNSGISPLERSEAERKGHRAPEAKFGKRNSGNEEKKTFRAIEI